MRTKICCMGIFLGGESRFRLSSHLMRFFDVILGVRTAAPTKLLPVMKIPLRADVEFEREEGSGAIQRVKADARCWKQGGPTRRTCFLGLVGCPAEKR